MRSESFSEERPNCRRRSRPISSFSFSIPVRRYRPSASACSSRASRSSISACFSITRRLGVSISSGRFWIAVRMHAILRSASLRV